MDSQTIETFFEQYYRDYNQLSQSEATIDELDTYWTSDLKVISYTPGPDGKYPQIYSNREQWKRFLNILHSFFDEILEPQDYIQAESRIVVKVRIINRQKGSSKVIGETEGVGIYQLDYREGKPQISQIEIYFGDPRQLRKPFRSVGKLVKFVRMLRTL